MQQEHLKSENYTPSPSLTPLLSACVVLAPSMTDLLNVHEGGEESWDPHLGKQSAGTRAGQMHGLTVVHVVSIKRLS